MLENLVASSHFVVENTKKTFFAHAPRVVSVAWPPAGHPNSRRGYVVRLCAAGATNPSCASARDSASERRERETARGVHLLGVPHLH